MKFIIISHAQERLISRGASEEEVQEVLERGETVRAKYGRGAKELVFPFSKTWQGKFYKQKKVKAVFVEEENTAVVITVYVYYGAWD